MNMQEALNKAVLGIVAQGALARSYPDERSSPRCRYLTSSGNRCAIGQLLTVEDAEEWENDIVGTVRMALSSGRIIPGYDHRASEEARTFLQDLQRSHDTSSSLDEFLVQAKRVAGQYELAFPVI